MEEQQKAARDLVGYSGPMPYRAQGFPWYDDVARLVDEGQFILEGGELVPQSKEASRAIALAGQANVKGMLYRRKLKEQFPDRFLSDDEILRRITEDTRKIRERAEDVGSRSDLLPQILGTMAGAVTDPLVLATLPIGAEGATAKGLGAAARVAARVGAREAAIAAVIESGLQAQAYQFKQDISSPFTKMDAIINVLAAGAGAGILRGAGSLTVDLIGMVERKLASREFDRLLEEAGFSRNDYEEVIAESKARLESKPRGMDLDTHSANIDAAIMAMDEGRLPEVDLPTARAVVGEVETRAAREFIEERIAELLPEDRLSLGDRQLLDRELSDLEFRIAQAESPARLEELVEARKAEGLTGRKAKQQAAKDQAREVKELRDRLDVVRERVARDDKARAAEAEVSRLEQKARKNPVETAKALGFKAPTKVVEALDAAQAVAQSIPTRTPETASMKADAERVAQAPPPKPKVDKGNVPAEMRAPPEPREAPREIPEELTDMQVSVDVDADGNPVTKTLKQVIEETDDELRGLDAVENCLNG
jgi:hypothetical protein